MKDNLYQTKRWNCVLHNNAWNAILIDCKCSRRLSNCFFKLGPNGKTSCCQCFYSVQTDFPFVVIVDKIVRWEHQRLTNSFYPSNTTGERDVSTRAAGLSSAELSFSLSGVWVSACICTGCHLQFGWNSCTKIDGVGPIHPCKEPIFVGLHCGTRFKHRLHLSQ